jgi:hypothetical protein
MTIRNIIKLLLNKPIPGKYAKIRKDDIFLVSFPKSGNTWLRFLIANYLYDNVDFNNINNLIPDIHISNNKHLNRIKKQRFIKSHFTFNSNYPRIIYIKRNIKDVLVSYFYWRKKRNPDTISNLDSFFNSFVNHGGGPYGTWVNHINDWSNRGKQDNILILNYEELKNNTYLEMMKVLKFCNLPLDKEKLLLAIKKSDIKAMSKLESKQRDSEFFKSYKNKDINFIRKNDDDRIENLNTKQLQILEQLSNQIL